MSSFDDLTNLYESENKDQIQNLLFEMIEGVLKNPSIIVEKNDSKPPTVEEILGSLKINSKKWGTMKESDERTVIRNYVSALGETTPEKILASLQSVVESSKEPTPEGEAPNCSVSRTLAKIQLLNTLSTILNSFDPRVGGFLNEAFLAALFDGNTIEVDRNSGIADFKVGEESYSLKTMASGSMVNGSLLKLLKDMKFDSAARMPKENMTYLAFDKISGEDGVTTSVRVERFVITPQNFHQLMGEATFSGKTLKGETGFDAVMSTVASMLSDGRKIGIKFSLDKSKIEKYVEPVAVLNTDTSFLYKTAEDALGDMVGGFKAIQEMFNSLVLGMNDYFASMTSTAAESFKKTANQFESVVSTTVRGDKTCSSD
jgi:hypothetical protein